MNSKHTPGPWHRNIKPITRYPVIFAGRNTHVAQVVTRGGSMPEAEMEANAALIVEAPAMLEALRDTATALERVLGKHLPADAVAQHPEVQAARAILARIGEV
jgi:hypothetical protein